MKYKVQHTAEYIVPKQLSIVLYVLYSFVAGITPPTALNISLNDTSMLDIHWNSDGNGYCYSIQSSAHGNWNHVNSASYTILLMNTYKISISLHHEMNMISNFTIGMCTSVVARNSKHFVCKLWCIKYSLSLL